MGPTTLAEHVANFTTRAAEAGFVVRDVQSNFEGDLIEAIRDARGEAVAIVVNAGALTHTSWALATPWRRFDGVKVEVHLSNPGGPRALPTREHLGRSGERLDRGVWSPELRPRL